jgi:hypothetical protein
MPEGGTLTWRDLVDKHQSALIDELTVRLDSEFQSALSSAVDAERREAHAQVTRAVDEARRLVSENLNQTLRRLRQSTSEDQILELLNEGSAAWSERSVVLVFENGQAHVVAARGIGATPFPEIAFETSGAPAVVSAIETRDPIVALASDSEVSPALARAVAGRSDNPLPDKAYLFPVISRQSVVAMLIASGSVSTPPLELLCEAAGMKIETMRTVPPPAERPVIGPSDLVQLAPVSPAPERRAWDDLSADERQLHLKAQRRARVRVSEMRLYHGDALRQGTLNGDIYGALRAGIDAARQEFRETFTAKSPTMVDYLHLEILGNLAQDNDRLLGPEYPGPMV